MKQRSVSSIFWDKRIEHSYSVSTSYLYLYLLTCKHIGLTPYYFLPEGFIPIETGLSADAVKKGLADLQERKQVYFFNNWVYIPNANEHNSFNTSSKTMVAYNAQLAKVPPEVLAHFDRVSIGYTDPIISGIDTRNNNNSNNNHNNNSNNAKIEKKEIREQAQELLAKWNEVHGTNFTSTTSIEKNLAEWLKDYSLDQILEGIVTTKVHHFWHDKMKPDTYLRHKNPRGEDVDYISEMLNYKPKKEFATAGADDKYKNL